MSEDKQQFTELDMKMERLMDGMDALVQGISDFGFPVIMALGMGYFIFFICRNFFYN